MKNKIEKIIVALFVITMFFVMSISAHAEIRHFYGAESSLSNISLDGVTIKPQETSVSTKEKARTIYNENVTHYVKVHSDDNTATDFTIETQSKGVLLVYYARTWGDNTVVNDANDLRINNLDGVAECYEIAKDKSVLLGYGVKYFVLAENTTYTMTATDLCGVYGFVYMPGNVAAYDVKGCESLMGQYCKDSYSNLPILQEEKWHFNGWYKDQARTVLVKETDAITEPTIIFASWTRYDWDFNEYSDFTFKGSIKTLDYDGILVKGYDSNDDSYTMVKNHCLNLISASTPRANCVVFTPEYDGEMTVTYSSTSNLGQTRMCAIGTDVVSNTNSSSVIAYGVSDDSNVWKTLQAKMKAGVTYYIFNVNGGIKIDKIKYQESAASAIVDGDNVTLTTIADMQGWRPFYDAYNSYIVDNNTDVYVVVGKEDEEDAVKLINRTGKKVPMACPVILHTDNVQEDGTYLITMTKDASSYEYEGNDNLLSASVTGTPVDAYRLGYRAGEGNGIAFYPWKADTPSAGVVYLDLSNSNNAKIAFEIEESITGVVSVRDNHIEGDNIFNINGQRLNVPQKGFNIINGKKVIVK